MGVLDAFLSTWSRARATFGEGTPQLGAQFDNSVQFQRVHDNLAAANPSSAWTGAAADRYAGENARHAGALGAMADLDRRLAAEIDQSAAVVTAGRRDLDSVKQWVIDAASGVPRTAVREQMLWPVVSKGSSEVAAIIARSHADMSAIAERMRGLRNEYEDLDEREDHGAEPVNFEGDDEKTGDVPETTLDLADIVYKAPGELGDPGMMELVPGSGAWVPDPRSPTYRPKHAEAPLDLNDIQYLGPGVKGQPWQMELVPGSGAWVPNPRHPSYEPHIPEAPVDLSEIQIVDPGPAIPGDMVELWPHSGILIRDPYLGRPF